MRTLLAPTEDFVRGERTTLTADVAAGANVTLTIENNDGYAEDTFIVVGREGSERAELAQINQAVTPGTTVRVATLARAHKIGEPVTLYRFNQRKFYGALTADGEYTELTGDGSPLPIGVDDPQGTLLEYSGATYLYFKATYYNSETATETDLDDSAAVSANDSSRYCTIYGIRKMAGFTNNPYISDGRIEDKRRQAENEINSSIMTRYSMPLAEVPPLLTYVCELLAAGYLHYEEYGQEGDGGRKLGEARAILKALGSGAQKLIGVDNTELAIVTNNAQLTGYPDSTSGRKFRMGQKF